MHGGHWCDWVRERESRGEAYVIATILGARGSTPRDSGTKMVVGAADFAGTIGGGELEYRAQARARELLAAGIAGQHLENYPLGEKLGQCCGGSASLLFECFVPDQPSVYLFGAGHVGRALAPLLAALPLRTHWVDARSDEFPAQLPEGVTTIRDEDPVRAVTGAPADSYFLIMTHQHPLDFALLEAVLRRGDAAYVGVIGSQSKARRFRLRLQHRGFDADTIARVHCPIGDPAVPGKQPAEIAVSVAAQLIAHYHARRGEVARAPGPSWKQVQASLSRTSEQPPQSTSTPEHDEQT